MTQKQNEEPPDRRHDQTKKFYTTREQLPSNQLLLEQIGKARYALGLVARREELNGHAKDLEDLAKTFDSIRSQPVAITRISGIVNAYEGEVLASKEEFEKHLGHLTGELRMGEEIHPLRAKYLLAVLGTYNSVHSLR